MRLYKIVFTVLLVSGATMLQAQNEKKLKKLAYKYFDYASYDEALPLLLKLDSLKPGDPKVNYEIGICYLHSHHQENALPYFKHAKEYGYESEGNAELIQSVLGKWVSDDLDFNLARAYHLHHEFDKAEKSYEEFKLKIKPSKHNEQYISRIERYIQECENGKELIKDTVNVIVESLGITINSEYPEYVPVITADESMMLFTSRRPNTTGGQRDPVNEDKWMEDIYFSIKDEAGNWSEPEHIHDNINTDDHDACIGISPDGEQLFIYRNDKHGLTGNIYVSHLDGEHWSVPEKMQEGINEAESWEGSASISADGNWLFFTSDREGGQGQRDIYWAKKKLDGTWATPQNLGAKINTAYDDDSPFIHPDGKTLYYSSQGMNSMGGFDIFETTWDEDKKSWSTPKNLGYPINTADDDIFFVFSADGKRAYFASHHEDNYGEEDIYVMHRPEKKQVSLIVLKGKLSTSDKGVPVSATITVTDNETANVVGVYNSNSFSGKYLIVLPPGKNYGLSIDAIGYLPFSDNVDLPDVGEYYEKTKDIALDPIEPGKVLVLRNVFFDYNKAELKKESFTELDNYLAVLQERPTLYVEFAGHTDSIGTEAYNQKLSEERAQAVVNYFIEKGIEKERLLASGYGEGHPTAPNSKRDGSDNPEGRALNRRTELIVHETLKEGMKWKNHYDKK